MIQIFEQFKRYFINLPGKKLPQKYVIFESDDWGSERMPSAEALNKIISYGIDVSNNPFNYLDTLETENDLSALFETLVKHLDRNGNPPIITANYITANPDFIKIKESDFEEYHYENILETFNHKSGCKNCFSMIKEGINQHFFYPQFHGREHLNVKEWLAFLKAGNEVILQAFDAGIYGIDFLNNHSKRANLMAAFDVFPKDNNDEQRGIIQEGTALFREIFGYASLSFIAPCSIWHPSLENILNENGIKYIQGLVVQFVPSKGTGYKKIYHFQGQRNNLNQFYFIRNCFFEPSLNPRIFWIKECLKRIEIAFSCGKPAIIGIHRINFMGSLNEENRKNNLEALSFLIKKILKKWPDVEFTTTDKLGQLYNNLFINEIRK